MAKNLVRPWFWALFRPRVKGYSFNTNDNPPGPIILANPSSIAFLLWAATFVRFEGSGLLSASQKRVKRDRPNNSIPKKNTRRSIFVFCICAFCASACRRVGPNLSPMYPLCLLLLSLLAVIRAQPPQPCNVNTVCPINPSTAGLYCLFNQTVCKSQYFACPATQYSSSGKRYDTSSAAVPAIPCDPCPIGTMCPSTGTSSPPACPVGWYNGLTAQLNCTICPAGSYCPEIMPPMNPGPNYAPVGQTATTTCPAGSICPYQGLSTPQTCPMGNMCPGAVRHVFISL
jgi:hypothetical protein